MAIKDEFATVDLIRDSQAETRGVDCFALSLIKAERQIRRLITFLVFQSDAFGAGDVAALRKGLCVRRVYFRHFLAAWDELYTKSLSELCGPRHDHLRERLEQATEIRNKIFHGQLTNKYLCREELFAYVDDIKEWCANIAEAAEHEVGYDGIDRSDTNGSFRKSNQSRLARRLRKQIESVADYEQFLKALVN